jgi:hypothetical protein
MSSKGRNNCSITRGPFCINKESITEMSKEFKDAYVQYIEMRFPEVKKNVSSCVKEIFVQDYWKLKSNEAEDDEDEKFGLYIFLGAVTGAIVILAIILLVVYVKKKSDNESTEEETLEEIE